MKLKDLFATFGSLPEELVQKLRTSIPDLEELTPVTSSKLPEDLFADMLGRMNADQIKYVAECYAPTNKSSQSSSNKKAILKAVQNPKVMAAMIDKLPPLELRMLQLLKANGGILSGWDLIFSLALYALTPEKIGAGTSISRERLVDEKWMRYLAKGLRDGLIFPNTTQASWFRDSSYYSYKLPSDDDDLVFTDSRLLAFVPSNTTPIPALTLTESNETTQGSHPMRALLEFFEVLSLALDDAGLQLTKNTTVPKNQYNRFLKKQPWLETYLELHLGILIKDQFFYLDRDDKPCINTEIIRDFLATAPKRSFSTLAQKFLNALTRQRSYYDGTAEKRNRFRKAILISLGVIGQKTYNVESLFEALDKRVFHVLKSAGDQSPTWFESFKAILKQEFSYLGIVNLSKNLGDVSAGVALAWLLEPNAKAATDKGLLVQPNFDVVVYYDQLSSLEPLLACSCKQLSTQSGTYAITRESVYRALQLGFDSHKIMALLEQHSLMPLPKNVKQSIEDWAGKRERLQVRQNIHLLEYHNQAERDTALTRMPGRAIGERFLLPELPKGKPTHDYNLAPARTIVFNKDGSFRLDGGLDFVARALVFKLCVQKNNTFTFDQELVQKNLSDAIRPAIFERVRGQIPPHLSALLELWQGKTKAPSIGSIEVFVHPLAKALAQHPSLAPCLGQAINETTYAVVPNMAVTLKNILAELGIQAKNSVELGAIAQKATDLAPLTRNLQTRKLREMIELAIRRGQVITIEYHDELSKRDRYGYTQKYQGKVLTERIVPEKIEYEASTPYFSGQLESDQSTRYVRIGYILGIYVG